VTSASGVKVSEAIAVKLSVSILPWRVRYRVTGPVFYSDERGAHTRAIPVGTPIEVSLRDRVVRLRWTDKRGLVRVQRISTDLWTTYVSGHVEPLYLFSGPERLQLSNSRPIARSSLQSQVGNKRPGYVAIMRDC
jgi:hypothetical protein